MPEILNSGGRKIQIYDTTLRDGAQDPGTTFSLENRIRALRLLDGVLKVDVIEGGFPHEKNRIDREFFQAAKDIELSHSKLAAFGATRLKNIHVEKDGGLRALIEARTPIVTLVGKASLWQVENVLLTDEDEGLNMNYESVKHLKEQGIQIVGFDAEHFFEGMFGNHKYDLPGNQQFALEALYKAAEGGADWIALCDTNGFTLTEEIQRGVEMVISDEKLHRIYRETHGGVTQKMPIGIHVHDDLHLAVANTRAAIAAGATQMQGTVNGFGERLGNANLLTLMLIRTEIEKIDYISEEDKKRLTELSILFFELAEANPNPKIPILGMHAYRPKGGQHQDGLLKHPLSYQYILPEEVGNRTEIVISEQTGKAGVKSKLEQMQFPYLVTNEFAAQVAEKIKEETYKGNRYKDADASFYLLASRLHSYYNPPFTVDISTNLRDKQIALISVNYGLKSRRQRSHTERIVLSSDMEKMFTAMKTKLSGQYSQAGNINLVSENTQKIDGKTKVEITVADSENPEKTWTTMGVDSSHAVAGLKAIQDALEYGIVHPQNNIPSSQLIS